MDKFIIGTNSSGKTRRMLENAKNSNAVVVCKYPLHMQNKANSYGIYGLRFVGYEEVNVETLNEEKVAIDELGEFFKYHFGVELDSFTITVD